MSNPYGRALSTYKRINKIKSSAMKISEAQSMINNQRVKAIAEAEDISRKADMVNSIGQGVLQIGSTLGQQFYPEHSDNIRDISTASSAAWSAGTNIATRNSLDDTQLAGLGRDGLNRFQKSMINPLDNAMETYGLNQLTAQNRLNQEYDDLLENIDLSETGLEKSQARRFLVDNVGSDVYKLSPQKFQEMINEYSRNRNDFYNTTQPDPYPDENKKPDYNALVNNMNVFNERINDSLRFK